MSLIFIHIKAQALPDRTVLSSMDISKICLPSILLYKSALKFTALAHNSHEIEDYKEQSKKNCLKRRNIFFKCLTKLPKNKIKIKRN